jgi:C-terminal processing protease CtpA/Prc
VTSALLDAGRGPIVGEHTFGRAGVQKIVPLADGGLLLTVAKYVSPKGTAVHGKGIEPTVGWTSRTATRTRPPRGRPHPRQGARSPEEPAAAKKAA